MIKFLLVDVKNIISHKQFTDFDSRVLDELADRILECEGILKPLVLKPMEPENYVVIEGDLEYFAAMRAREKDSQKGKMINAFVISPNDEEIIRKQLSALRGQTLLLPKLAVSHEQMLSMTSIMEMVQRLEQCFHRHMEKVDNRLGRLEEVVDFHRLEDVLTQRLEILRREIEKISEDKTKHLHGTFLSNLSLRSTSGYENMKLKELKELARDRHLKGYSNLKKHELVAIHREYDMYINEPTRRRL